MNRKMILSTLSKMLFAEGLLLIVPMIVSLIYGEPIFPFAVVAGGLIVVGGIGSLISPKDKAIYSKDGFFIVGLVWILWSACGALPFVISGAIPNFIDAFFETVSGFTTTGSTILRDVEALPMSMLFWRSFTHWVGGMGVLVFVAAIIPLSQGRSMFILKAEMPGPSADKLVPKTKKTAQYLYVIYFVMTVVMIVMLIAGGMPVFDSFVNAFGTAGTGGFAVKNAGIAAYNSPYAEIVMTVFMCLFSLNFNLYFLLIMKKFKSVLRNEEMWTFIGLFVVSSAAIALNIIQSGTLNNAGEAYTTGDAIRTSAFQVSSVMSSSGFTTADFTTWSSFTQSLLLVLMFIGACAGSTGGGMKVVRLVLMGKIIKRDLRQIARPRNVYCVRMDGEPVDEGLLRGVKTYMLVYFAIVFGAFLFLSIEGRDIVTTFSSVVTCFNNIGPGLGKAFSTFADYSPCGKILLSICMLLGRLEIYPILMLFMPSLWRRKSL